MLFKSIKIFLTVLKTSFLKASDFSRQVDKNFVSLLFVFKNFFLRGSTPVSNSYVHNSSEEERTYLASFLLRVGDPLRIREIRNQWRDSLYFRFFSDFTFSKLLGISFSDIYSFCRFSIRLFLLAVSRFYRTYIMPLRQYKKLALWNFIFTRLLLDSRYYFSLDAFFYKPLLSSFFYPALIFKKKGFFLTFLKFYNFIWLLVWCVKQAVFFFSVFLYLLVFRVFFSLCLIIFYFFWYVGCSVFVFSYIFFFFIDFLLYFFSPFLCFCFRYVVNFLANGFLYFFLSFFLNIFFVFCVFIWAVVVFLYRTPLVLFYQIMIFFCIVLTFLVYVFFRSIVFLVNFVFSSLFFLLFLIKQTFRIVILFVWNQLKGVQALFDLLITILFTPYVMYLEAWRLYLRWRYSFLAIFFSIGIVYLSPFSLWRVYMAQSSWRNFPALGLVLLILTLKRFFSFVWSFFLFLPVSFYILLFHPRPLLLLARGLARVLFVPLFPFYAYIHNYLSDFSFEAINYIILSGPVFKDPLEPALFSWSEEAEEALSARGLDGAQHSGLIEPFGQLPYTLNVSHSGAFLFRFSKSGYILRYTSKFFWVRQTLFFFLKKQILRVIKKL